MAPRRFKLKCAFRKFQRIEGPLDQTNIAAQGFVALKEFQLSADAAIAIVGWTPV